jgi:hypothetical protein
MFNKPLILGVAAAFLAASPCCAQSPSSGDVEAIAVILDCSGSMSAPTTEREPKMVAAKRVVSTLLRQLPSTLDVTFVIYGHDAKLSCEAVKIVRPLGPYDGDAKQELISFVQTLKPTGQTPIALALKTTGDELAKTKKRSQIILVTDGMETCGGDPAAEAKDLFRRLNFQSVEVVGVDVSAKEAAGVRTIADAGKGSFINAKNAKELGAAFQKVMPTVGTVKVEPPSITMKKTVVSAIIVEKLAPKGFGKIDGVAVYEAGAYKARQGTKSVQSGEAGVPMIVQPGNYDVYINAYLQDKICIASGLELGKNQTVALDPNRLIGGVVVKDLGIAGVQVGSINAVKKGAALELRNRVQSVSRFGEVMLLPPNVPLDVHLTPYLAKPMLLQTVVLKPGELITIGGDVEEKKAADPEPQADAASSKTPSRRSGPDMTVVLIPGADQTTKTKSNLGERLDFGGAFINDSTPKSLDDAMSRAAIAKSKIKSVAFAPNGGWCVLHGDHSFAEHGIPQEAKDKLQAIARDGKPLKAIAFTVDGGWCVLFDFNGYYAKGIPQAAFEELGKLADGDGRELKSISFTSDGGWCILFDKSGYRCRDIPEAAEDELKRRANEDQPLKCVAFAPDGGWSVLYSFNGFYNSGDATKSAHQIIKDVVHDEKAELFWLAYAPREGWSVLRGENKIDWGFATPNQAPGHVPTGAAAAPPATTSTPAANMQGKTVEELMQQFKTGVRQDQVRAAIKLGEMGAGAKDAVEELAKAVGYQRPTKFEAMIVGFGGGIAMAQGRADPVRGAAAQALFKIDKEALIAALEKARGCANLGVQVWARKCLDDIRGVQPAPQTPGKKFKTLGPQKTLGGS